MTAPIVIRSAAAEACAKRFAGRRLKWGTVDCAKIASHNLRKLGISTGLLKGLTWSSEHGALRALRSLGHDTLASALDAMPGLFRIPPAAATTADIIGMQAEGKVWDMALVVGYTNGRVFGIDATGVAAVLRPDLSCAIAAWRCNPCRR